MSKADLHVHTNASDGVASPAMMVQWAARKGLDTIAITDHNTMDGVCEAQEFGRKFGVEVIPGCEVTTKQGHLIGLWLEEPPKKGRGWRYTSEAIQEQGGISLAPHPFMRKPRGVAFFLPNRLLSLDAVEVINGGPMSLRANARALRWWQKHMGKYAATANTDSHMPTQLGLVWTEYEGDLREAILNRRTGIGSI